MYALVTGCKKWHTRAAYWNVHVSNWVQKFHAPIARCDEHARTLHSRRSAFGSGVTGRRSTHHYCEYVTKSLRKYYVSSKKRKENLRDFLCYHRSDHPRLSERKSVRCIKAEGCLNVGEIVVGLQYFADEIANLFINYDDFWATIWLMRLMI